MLARLIADMSSDEDGEVSPSVYETARVVALAPWLAGHGGRLRFLLTAQHGDGRWGGPEGYGLLPTLSATEALLASLRRPPQAGVDGAALVTAADRGLHWLLRRQAAGRRGLPDMIAAEVLVPALIEQVNAHLDGVGAQPAAEPHARWGSVRLTLPPGMDGDLLHRLRNAVRDGHPPPATLCHSLEALGPAAVGAAFVEPAGGAVGCSPASSAAWLGDRPPARPDHPTVRYLEAVQARHGGPVPGVSPITVFERAWVLAAMASAGTALPVPRKLVDELDAAFGESGVPGGPGLPADSDDTATALYALAHVGAPRPPDCLWSYRAGAYFRCFPTERTPSTSTNAHVLRAIGMSALRGLASPSRCSAAIRPVTGWLAERQERDGSWWDKWHASPYYATSRCVMALARCGSRTGAAAVRRAVDWVLDSQREDGSWGRWAGTFEETAYAVQALMAARLPAADRVRERAVAKGCAFLLRWPDERAHPPLWHDKDLYTPTRVVRAEGAAALRLALADPGVAGRLAEPEAATLITAGHR